jgi:hypothetical protein
MGEVVRFVPKSELERVRLIREARAIYESIFPDAEGPDSRHVDSLEPFSFRLNRNGGSISLF